MHGFRTCTGLDGINGSYVEMSMDWWNLEMISALISMHFVIVYICGLLCSSILRIFLILCFVAILSPEGV